MNNPLRIMMGLFRFVKKRLKNYISSGLITCFIICVLPFAVTLYFNYLGGFYIVPYNPNIRRCDQEETSLQEHSYKKPLRKESQRLWFFNNGTVKPNHSDSLIIWPSEYDCNDRIVNQLLFVPGQYDEISPPKKILLWYGFDNWKYGNEMCMDSNCPVNKCILTDDRSLAESVDAILFIDFFFGYFDMPKHTRPSKQIWIIYLMECPYFGGILPRDDLFNWTATYRTDSDLVIPYAKWVYYDNDVVQSPPQQNYAANKTGKVLWIVSNGNARNERNRYARELGKFIQVDVYGSMGMPCVEEDRCSKLAEVYKFYLSFENSRCRNYITEKLFKNALQHDTIPIVMGPGREDYEMVAPYHSFIHVDDFNSPKELAEYLVILDNNDELYNSYFCWKGTGEFIDHKCFCRLCAMLHSDFPVKTYRWKDWWYDNACTRYEYWYETVYRIGYEMWR